MSLVEREFEALRSQRVALRKTIEALRRAAVFEPQKKFGPDGSDNRIANFEMQLRGTEKRWQELHLLLGRRLNGPPVKLNTPPRAQPTPRQVARDVPGYVTKVIRNGY